MVAVTRSQARQTKTTQRTDNSIRRNKWEHTRKLIAETVEPYLSFIYQLLFDSNNLWVTGRSMLLVEFIMCFIVVYKIPYTEIDWKAYMEQDHYYPAGHLYIYTGLYLITDSGANIKLAQWIFALVYLLTLIVVFRIYHTWNKLPPYALVFMCCSSYRVHSIYMLRMFNDPLAMLLLYSSMLLWINRKWTLGCIVYSLSVSVKMNILLFAPALGVILLVTEGKFRTICHVFNCALVQILLAVPFLAVNPRGYVERAFNLGRVFLHQWTVNWRFLPEHLFVDRRFHISLLAMHLLVLVFFAFFVWFRSRGGFCKLLTQKETVTFDEQFVDEMLFALFSSNFIGIAFARSLHYQFYCWYFHSLPFLLWSTAFHPVMKLFLMGVIEVIWNTYPSRNWSSMSLHAVHLVILMGVVFAKLRQETRKKNL